jgi:cytochrome c-type biogenesis protein CcmH/NrfG
MELKLQQAIVATRAGRTDVAQQLLTQAIRENPNDADAWFLLGHLVDAPDRQALYLEKAVELEPDHAVAKQRLMQLEKSPIPAPDIPQQDTQDVVVELNSDETAPKTAATNELPEQLQDLDDKQLEAASTDNETWQDSAGMPVREAHKASKPAAASSVAQNTSDPIPAGNSTSAEVRLVRILVIMVIIAAIVLGILVLLILI